MLSTEETDFLCIGSGPSGQKGAIQASKSGKKVIVVEGWETGGSSLWTGTIPSKALREAILDLTNFKEKCFYADLSKLPKPQDISISDLNFRVDWVKNHLKKTISRQMKKNGIEVVPGVAKFLDQNTVVVSQNGIEKRKFHAKTILLATGSKPRRPKGIDFDGVKIFDSTTLLTMKNIPKSMIVLGAGVIGTEYASMFSLLGTKVYLIDKRSRMLSFLDHEIGAYLQVSLEENNLVFFGNKDYTYVEKKGDECEVGFSDGTKISAETVLVAAGREANVDGLDIGNAGLSLNDRSYLTVSEFFQTSKDNIYAAGDIIDGPCLSSTGYVQGRLAGLNACGIPANFTKMIYPYGIYTIPEISSVGITEEEAIDMKIEYQVGRAYFYEISKCVISGTESGFCKLIFNPKNFELLGAHIIGLGASESIHIAQLAISFNLKIDYFVEHVFNFPTFAEVYRIAALNGINKCKKGFMYGNLQHL
jgi:NAD(P) transhydrogenase